MGRHLDYRPVVVGFGPAGMFAAYLLAKAGYRPIILERGRKVEERVGDVERFMTGGELDTESNIAFGEGGAGTFSDGKLNTGIRDKRIRFVLETFVAYGAPVEILYDAKPHIGTDKLTQVVRDMRLAIEAMGGEVHFGAKFTGFVQESGQLRGIIYEKDGVTHQCNTHSCILAIGHSARDTFEMLYKSKIALEKKNFAVGVRIEHLQEKIDRAMYGRISDPPRLPVSSYKLAVHLPNRRALYTFCMCPGGEVVPSVSQAGHLVVNGMSRYARDGKNANSALLVGISASDMVGESPLAGIEFQRKLERDAFLAAGGNYAAPVCTVGDFLEKRSAQGLGKVIPSYRRGIAFVSPEVYLPDFVVETLRGGIREMGKRIDGFDDEEAVLTGVESRSSSPVRIVRGESGESVSIRGIYPCGEGAGYAGGIMSAAVDGIHGAEKVMRL